MDLENYPKSVRASRDDLISRSKNDCRQRILLHNLWRVVDRIVKRAASCDKIWRKYFRRFNEFSSFPRGGKFWNLKFPSSRHAVMIKDEGGWIRTLLPNWILSRKKLDFAFFFVVFFLFLDKHNRFLTLHGTITRRRGEMLSDRKTSRESNKRKKKLDAEQHGCNVPYLCVFLNSIPWAFRSYKVEADKIERTFLLYATQATKKSRMEWIDPWTPPKRLLIL
jgi:hypothetical protein